MLYARVPRTQKEKNKTQSTITFSQLFPLLIPSKYKFFPSLYTRGRFGLFLQFALVIAPFQYIYSGLALILSRRQRILILSLLSGKKTIQKCRYVPLLCLPHRKKLSPPVLFKSRRANAHQLSTNLHRWGMEIIFFVIQGARLSRTPSLSGTLATSLRPGGWVGEVGSKLGGVAPGFKPRTSCMRVRSETITLRGPPFGGENLVVSTVISLVQSVIVLITTISCPQLQRGRATFCLEQKGKKISGPGIAKARAGSFHSWAQGYDKKNLLSPYKTMRICKFPKRFLDLDSELKT